MRFTLRARRVAPFAVLSLSLFLAAPRSASAAGESVLLALGDSFAWGFQTDALAIPGNGDQGYVKDFADYLATVNGGVRPNVLSYAIPGESSNSFLSGLSAVKYPDVYPYSSTLEEAPRRFPPLNTNYPASTPPSYATDPQKKMALDGIAAVHAAGNTVDNITLQVGGNDILGLILQPAFFQLPAQQQEDLFTAQFAKLQNNYADILGSVRLAAPEAKIFTIGYPNSFRQTPFGGRTDLLTQTANAIISGISENLGAKYVNIYEPFKGHEEQLTYEKEFNPHPNNAGYAVISAQVIATATAPEPATLALFALALPIVGLVARRRSVKSVTVG